MVLPLIAAPISSDYAFPFEGNGNSEEKATDANSVSSLTMRSRLKGIETSEQSLQREHGATISDVPSRLKGMETQHSRVHRGCCHRIFVCVSRLKGMETFGAVSVIFT